MTNTRAKSFYWASYKLIENIILDNSVMWNWFHKIFWLWKLLYQKKFVKLQNRYKIPKQAWDFRKWQSCTAVQYFVRRFQDSTDLKPYSSILIKTPFVTVRLLEPTSLHPSWFTQGRNQQVGGHIISRQTEIIFWLVGTIQKRSSWVHLD